MSEPVDLPALCERTMPTRDGFYHVVGAYRVMREEDFDALVAEVERLRAVEADAEDAKKERATVVAWLREVSERRFPRNEREQGIVCRLAHEIERGEHRREGEK